MSSCTPGSCIAPGDRKHVLALDDRAFSLRVSVTPRSAYVRDYGWRNTPARRSSSRTREHCDSCPFGNGGRPVGTLQWPSGTLENSFTQQSVCVLEGAV